jgi:hypothetical protein
MAYTLKLTDGRILLSLPDQTSDSVSTSLTLIGKNVNAYGTDINQNYIRILENFANTREPTAPLQGQLWFDTVSQQLKVYTFNNVFKPVGIPTISSTEPTALGVGDLWFDSTSEQLKFKKDAATFVTIGPDFNAAIGKAGWVVEEYLTDLNTTVTAVSLYSNNQILGILSDAPFTINDSNTTTTIREVGTGFTPEFSDGNETKWNGTATTAEALVDGQGNIYTPESFINDEAPIVIENPVSIYNDFVIGLQTSPGNFTDNIKFYMDSGVAKMYNAVEGQDFRLDVNSTIRGANAPALYINGVSGNVGIFTTTPTSDFSVEGDVTISGNLYVLGTQTNVSTQDLQVIDKVITLAWTSSGVLSTASYSGGGIELNSAPYRKYVKWFDEAIDVDDLGVQTGSINVWQVSDNFELRYSTATYKIAGYDVLSETALGDRITDAPGLVNFGALSSAKIGTLRFTQTGVHATTIGTNPTANTSTIIIGDNNIQDIQFAGRLLRNAQTPTRRPVDSGPEYDDYLKQVATVEHVLATQEEFRNLKATLTIDVTGYDGGGPEGPAMDNFVVRYLGYMLDPTLPGTNGVFDGTIARVLCVSYASPAVISARSDLINFDQLNVSTPGGGEATAVQWADAYYAFTSFSPTALTVKRCVKQYKVSGSVWEPWPLTVGGNNIVNRDDWPE